MIEDQYKSINKGNLFASTEKLKRVLHPTITREAWPSYEESTVIELVTDILETDEQYPISFYIKCLNFIDPDTKVISSEGFIASNLNEYGVINPGSSKLLKIASKLDGVLKIALIPEDGVILKTEAEVFVCDDNKNHLVAINYIEENDEYYDFQDITGDIDTNFHYLINTGSEYINIENGVNRTQPIDTIYHSVDALELTHPINVKIKGVDSNDNSKLIFESPLTLIGTQSGDETTIIAQVSVEDIAESVKEEVLDEFPIADIDVVGGIALTTKSNLETNQFPIKLTNNHLAYIDLSNYQPSMTADIHRFAVIPADAATAGTNLILYIGATTADYVRGYYYLWAPTEFTVSSESDGWSEIREGGQGVAGNKIAAYNRERDFILKVNTPIVVTLSDTLTTGDLISNDTLFNISQGNTFTEDITYSDIKSKLGFELSSGFITYDSTKDYNLTLSLTTTASAWKQKNVLPMVKVGSPLFFKGTTTWEELQSYSPTAEIGDFYIVSDKANLEYYWTGTEWEFMGDIFDPYEGGDGINITSTHDISVKYDNVTIKKNNDGNLYVDGELTDTLSNWNETNTSSAAYILNKPTIPTVNDATYSVKTDVAGTETTVSNFTANLSTADSVTFVQGSNITLTPDSTNKKITIAATDTTYNTATSSIAGLVKSQTTGTTIGRDYNVEVNSNGTMKVNVPWTDTVTSIGGVEKAITTDGTGGSNNIHTFVPTGAIQMYAGNTAPTGWLLCNGNIILIDSNSKSIAQEIQSQSFTAEALDDLLDVIGTSFGSFIIRRSPSNDNKYIKNGTLSGTTFTVLSWTKNVQQAYLFTADLVITQYQRIISGDVISDMVNLNVISIPDLRKTFPVGASSTTSAYNLGKTGGEATHALTESEMPRHTHSVIVDTNPSTGQTSFTSVYPINQVNTAEDASLDTNNDKTATNTIVRYTGGSGSTEVAANGVAHNNIPPYLALNFIIKY